MRYILTYADLYDVFKIYQTFLVQKRRFLIWDVIPQPVKGTDFYFVLPWALCSDTLKKVETRGTIALVRPGFRNSFSPASVREHFL